MNLFFANGITQIQCWGTGHFEMVLEARERIIACFDNKQPVLNLAVSKQQRIFRQELVYSSGPDVWIRGKHFYSEQARRTLNLRSFPDLSSLVHVTHLKLDACTERGWIMQSTEPLDFSLLAPHLEELNVGEGVFQTY